MSQKAKKPTMELETILHEDLVYEIFLYLPVKSLARFKCISKHWNSLISSRRFAKTLLERYPEPSSTLFLFQNIEGETISPPHNADFKVDYPLPHKFKDYMAVVTYHGLICISHTINGDAYVWNPATKQLRMFKSQRPLLYALVGFGYDAVNDDYKVVKILQRMSNLTIEIWEFRNTETRVIHLPLNQVPFWLSNARPVTVNGSSHWIAFHREKGILEIVRFDMDHEKFVEIPFSSDMPNIKSDVRVNVDVDDYLRRRTRTGLTLMMQAGDRRFVHKGTDYSLGVLKGSLCLFISTLWRTEAWLMDCKNIQDGVVWTKLFDIPKLFEIPLSDEPEEVVIGSTYNDQVVFRHKYNDFAYDTLSGKYFHLKSSCNHHYAMTHAVPYAESLVNVRPQ